MTEWMRKKSERRRTKMERTEKARNGRMERRNVDESRDRSRDAK